MPCRVVRGPVLRPLRRGALPPLGHAWRVGRCGPRPVCAARALLLREPPSWSWMSPSWGTCGFDSRGESWGSTAAQSEHSFPWVPPPSLCGTRAGPRRGTLAGSTSRLPCSPFAEEKPLRRPFENWGRREASQRPRVEKCVDSVVVSLSGVGWWSGRRAKSFRKKQSGRDQQRGRECLPGFAPLGSLYRRARK